MSASLRPTSPRTTVHRDDVVPRSDLASKLDTDSFDLDEAVADACREFLLPSDTQDSGVLVRLSGGDRSIADGDVETDSDDDEDAVERMLAQMMGAEE